MKKKENYKSREKLISLLLGLGCGFAVIFLAFVFFLFYEEKGPFSYLDNTVYNYFYRGKKQALARCFETEDLKCFSTLQPVALVKIDEETLADERFGRWPFPRSRYGELLNRLEKGGARTVLIDILFQEPSFPQEDKALAEALSKNKNVILCGNFVLEGGEVGFRAPLAALTAQWPKTQK